jgi:hypothetical protein
VQFSFLSRTNFEEFFFLSSAIFSHKEQFLSVFLNNSYILFFSISFHQRLTTTVYMTHEMTTEEAKEDKEDNKENKEEEKTTRMKKTLSSRRCFGRNDAIAFF